MEILEAISKLMALPLFVWIVFVERRLMKIQTTCKLKCGDNTKP